MVNVNEIYKCEVCGNVVEVTHPGTGELTCCGRPMVRLEEKTADVGTEKHVPYVEWNGDHYTVSVGKEVKHPMSPEHYIAWIELVVDGEVYRKNLEPSDEPVAEFYVSKGKNVYAREYCTLHGLWKYGGE